MVLLHGWPDSFLRFERVLPLLTDVNVVVPCLPGYPYAYPPTSPGMSTAAMAEVVAGAMADLGYDRYVVSGGDVGSSVAEALADAHPERVAALHLTDVPYTHLFTVDAGELSEEEQSYLADGSGAGSSPRARTPWSSRPSRTRWPSAWVTRRPGWRRGSWRSCAAGATAAATSSRCSRATTC